MGVAEGMLAGDFSVSDWNTIANQEILSALFRYLHSVGLLTVGTTADYALTPLGRTSVGRNGAFITGIVCRVFP